jgi:hypothetical protein
LVSPDLHGIESVNICGDISPMKDIPRPRPFFFFVSSESDDNPLSGSGGLQNCNLLGSMARSG